MALTSESWIMALHALVTSCFIWWMVFRVYQPRKLDPSTPSELTTCGILGTFTGIFLGLFPFLLSGGGDISRNIPGLIGGIAVAAICSMCGMVLALLSKNKQRLARISEVAADQHQHTGATADTLADLLRELIQHTQTQNANLSTLQKSIAGDEDGTLLTQIQKLRTSSADKQDALIRSFESFAERMTKSNSDALILALKEVIRDFNAKISEQFGDNFKHLNEAVGRLLEWLEVYRAQYELCLKGIDSSEKAMSSIADKSQSVVDAAAKLQHLLVAFDGYRANLENHLEAFASLSQDAQDAFPVIRNNLKELTQHFSNAVQASTAEIEETIRKTSHASQASTAEMEETVRRTSNAVQAATAEIEETVRKTSKRLEDQVSALDEALQEELTKSLSSLGNQLASLSGKFVSDYTPLTDQLERLVKSASYAGTMNDDN